MKVKTKISTLRSAVSIIEQKKLKKELSAEDIEYFIQEMMKNNIEDHQVSALLMAIYLNGMSAREVDALTDAMLKSGKSLPFLGKNAIDKHSTGGIGDKTSFILAPIAAAAGVLVPMIAGRGLGHTGGTVDKIEAIKGFHTQMSLEQFQAQLKNIGLVLIGQTSDIAPADKKIYALRDVTSTIDHVGLITASIMSKKLAEGTAGLVLDIKIGNGAFMQNMKDATLLAKSLVRTAKRFKKKAVAIITDMNQPLGQSIGHSNELIECFEILKGRKKNRLSELSIALAAQMIYMAGITTNLKNALLLAQKTITDGSAIKILKEMISAQNGQVAAVDNYQLLPQAKTSVVIKSKKQGWLKSVATKELGNWLIEFGGGRKKKTDPIDFAVGFECLVEVGDYVKKNQNLFIVHCHDHQLEIVKKFEKSLLEKIFVFSNKNVSKLKLMYKTIRG
jgi:pyrimidine-nucleoside phosphorylase